MNVSRDVRKFRNFEVIESVIDILTTNVECLMCKGLLHMRSIECPSRSLLSRDIVTRYRLPVTDTGN